ncbi:MAG: HAMP domain-containing protein [Lachnospiraceae bacterium]|nr:HAMP domain-containing protein [Lachnospiraceae bacterium]
MNKSIFGSVRGRFLLTGILGVAAALIIGLVGIGSISKNSSTSEVVSLVNDISVMQTENLANDALYQYYVDSSYIDATLDNLNSMNAKATELKALSDASYGSSVDSILDLVGRDSANYEEILSIQNSRGYDPNSGTYSQFIASSADLKDSFSTLVNNNDWVEIKWTDTSMWNDGTDVSIDGTDYYRVVYDKELPVVGKRNNMGFRVGGTLTFDKCYYVTNIVLVNGSETLPIDLSKVEQLQMSGDGLAAAEVVEFNGSYAIKVTGKFNADNGGWEEVAVGIDIRDYDLQDYPTLQYEIYFEKTEGAYDYKYGGSISGVYGFADNLNTLDSLVAEYSKLVVEGKDVSSNIAEIEALFDEIENYIPKYTTDPALAEISLEKLAVKRSLFDQMKESDIRTLEIKAENAEINAQLSDTCAKVQSSASENMETVRKSVSAVIMIVIILSVVILAGIVILVSTSITKSVRSFKDALEQIAAGNVSVRADDRGKDEFAEFSSSLNGFMDTLEPTIVNLKELTKVLAESGIALEESANHTRDIAGNVNATVNEITKGAGDQAKDIENSSQKIVDMRGNISDIIESVGSLSETSANMSEKEKQASDIMASLTEASDKTNEAFTGIVSQVRKTDESVEKIAEAVSLIASIATQTNLLSLNASIEAARAGEAGRGFAVVATEISKLAEQTNESAGIIEGIIKNLSEESKQTVETINSVTDMIEGQKSRVDETREKFSGVSEGIKFTANEVKTVLEQAKSSGRAGEQLVDLMTNLSAISEENAASAETTNQAMNDLNEATVSLANTAQELKRLSDQLNEDLEFFKIG